MYVYMHRDEEQHEFYWCANTFTSSVYGAIHVCSYSFQENRFSMCGSKQANKMYRFLPFHQKEKKTFYIVFRNSFGVNGLD